MNPLKDEDVLPLFAELDRKHYAGALTAAGYRVSLVQVAGLMEAVFACDEDVAGWCLTSHRLILIDKDGDHQGGVRATLLHEMAHAKVDLDRPLSRRESPHGGRFWDEIGHLIGAGEECLGVILETSRP